MIVIVVCYFGGIFFGIFGFINVYKLSIVVVLEEVMIIIRLVEDVYCLEFDYGLMS